MNRTIPRLALNLFIFALLALAPAARTAVPVQALEDGNATYRETVPAATVRTADEIAAFWTEERMAAAQPLPESVIGRSASSEAVRAPLAQADGPARFVNGYNPAGTETAAVNGTVGGSSTQTPNYVYPFPYTRTYLNIPIMAQDLR